MTDKVIRFPGVSRLDFPAAQILEDAAEAGLDHCLVIGHTEAGEFYFAASMADGAEALWLIERAKHKLMQIMDEMEDADG